MNFANISLKLFKRLWSGIEGVLYNKQVLRIVVYVLGYFNAERTNFDFSMLMDTFITWIVLEGIWYHFHWFSPYIAGKEFWFGLWMSIKIRQIFLPVWWILNVYFLGECTLWIFWKSTRFISWWYEFGIFILLSMDLRLVELWVSSYNREFCDFEESIDFSVISLFYVASWEDEISYVKDGFTRKIKGFTIFGSITGFWL